MGLTSKFLENEVKNFKNQIDSEYEEQPIETKKRILNTIISTFYKNRKELDHYKKETDLQSKEIKEIMNELDKTEFETDTGLIAKITTQKRESFDEDKLLEKIKDLNLLHLIKTKEYVDMDELENAIYNGDLDAKELTPCKETKQIITLKVTEVK